MEKIIQNTIKKIEKEIKSQEIQKLGFYRYNLFIERLKSDNNVKFDFILMKKYARG